MVRLRSDATAPGRTTRTRLPRRRREDEGSSLGSGRGKGDPCGSRGRAGRVRTLVRHGKRTGTATHADRAGPSGTAAVPRLLLSPRTGRVEPAASTDATVRSCIVAPSTAFQVRPKPNSHDPFVLSEEILPRILRNHGRFSLQIRMRDLDRSPEPHP